MAQIGISNMSFKKNPLKTNLKSIRSLSYRNRTHIVVKAVLNGDDFDVDRLVTSAASTLQNSVGSVSDIGNNMHNMHNISAMNSMSDMSDMSSGLDDNTATIVYMLVVSVAMGAIIYNIVTVSNMYRGNGKTADQVATRPNVKFDDVAGAVAAKADLVEVVDFLKNPKKYTALGARIPRGVLLTGPPGCGKTLLAKAVAGEANVPFYAVSASSFIEMFVGMGASRVRELFTKAAKNAPCIVFIDEIDAVGRQRLAMNGHGGDTERDQTINQLLVSMDGFDTNHAIIVLAATNRDDVLDPALTRPGRFDRKVEVELPNVVGRKKILEVHTRGKPLHLAVDLQSFARRTPGFTGADLANLANEAAILAAVRSKSEIGVEEMEDALDRIMIGAMKNDTFISPDTVRIVAYHEAGHALVAMLLTDRNHDNSHVVHKVSIVRRGSAGGVTIFNPDESHGGIHQRQYFLNQMCIAMAGRAAEEVVFDYGQVTSGAINDIEKATAIARLMVTKIGLSDAMGAVALEHEEQSESNKEAIDAEIRKMVEAARERAMTLISENIVTLKKIAGALIEFEILTGADIERIIREPEVAVALLIDRNGADD